ncbi:MAG: rRNA pseudouridine synthase [Butyrivibrio sp.]|nr:rRNA pseudouridine synthase [Butyrivibrio sp.]
MRLNKFIALCGICSRRDADRLIESGKITVNGSFPLMGTKVSDNDVICLDGKVIKPIGEYTYLAYYKPVGVVCTERDEHAQKTVTDDLHFEKRVTYAGRLDKDSEGLLIMTDDGDLINAMMRGSFGHEKEYEVRVDHFLTDDFFDKMSEGVYLPELKQTTRKCSIKRLSESSFDIVLTQGLNRQIRRMCEILGYKVVFLKRIRVMNVSLQNHALLPGEYEALTKEEVKELLDATGLKYERS